MFFFKKKKLVVSLENKEAEQARSTTTIPGVIHLCHRKINKSISVNVPGFYYLVLKFCHHL